MELYDSILLSNGELVNFDLGNFCFSHAALYGSGSIAM